MTEDAPLPAALPNHPPSPHMVAMGFQLVAVGPEGCIVRAPYREDLVGDPATGVIAGGVVTTLLDHVCGLATGVAAGALSGGAAPVGAGVAAGGATLDLRIDYMRPATPRRDLLARAHCYKLTHTFAFLRASAYQDDPDDPVATAQGVFVLQGAPPATAP